MYSYTYDPATGGIVLNTTPTGFSKEPRPVYAPELDLLGFDKYWKYDKQDDVPYMWAEANEYIYRGTLVAKLKGGNIFTAPEISIPSGENGKPVEPEPDGNPLKPIDIEAMVEANREMMLLIEQTTAKKVIGVYKKYKDKVDCFYVAFSGGKDSCVLLDIVMKALPKERFIVLFGDTGMELPDTYELIPDIQTICTDKDISFYIAKSHITSEESWKIFGPPSRTLRWCCSVHKTTPQILKLREIMNKTNFMGLAYTGVRSHESIKRSHYEAENFGEKVPGQYTHHSLIDWTSAEIWLYIYIHSIIINKAYKKGRSRAGCILCPNSSGKQEYFDYINYRNYITKYIDYIKNTAAITEANINNYIIDEVWKARKSGRDIINNPCLYADKTENGYLCIETIGKKHYYKEWLKTLDLEDDIYSVEETMTGYIGKIPESIIKMNPSIGKKFKQVFRKIAYCVNCKLCEANCSRNSLTVSNDSITIQECTKCNNCHNVNTGCIVFQSKFYVKGENTQMKSLNTMSDHVPETGWLEMFFEKKNDFFSEHTLGPNQFSYFKRYLKDAGLREKNIVTPFTSLVNRLGWNTDVAQGLMYINLVSSNPQLCWYISNFDINKLYPREIVLNMLSSDLNYNLSTKMVNTIYKAYGQLTETPLGTSLHFGHVTDSGDLVRTKCSISDHRVILYGLYKFAEKCGDYREFTLATLLNDSIERDGISPTRIFGLDRDDMVPILLGLSVKYPDFINASFTHDLEKITLSSDKASGDVLGLF